MLFLNGYFIIHYYSNCIRGYNIILSLLCFLLSTPSCVCVECLRVCLSTCYNYTIVCVLLSVCVCACLHVSTTPSCVCCWVFACVLVYMFQLHHRVCVVECLRVCLSTCFNYTIVCVLLSVCVCACLHVSTTPTCVCVECFRVCLSIGIHVTTPSCVCCWAFACVLVYMFQLHHRMCVVECFRMCLSIGLHVCCDVCIFPYSPYMLLWTTVYCIFILNWWHFIY